MSEIVIRIQIPDGSSIKVDGGSPRSNKPFVQRDAPPTPDGECPVHGVDWKLIPAGVSKKVFDDDGNPKRYNAFWVCPERGCDEKPPREGSTDDLGF